MEQGGGPDARGLTLEIGAAGELDVFELLDCGEMPIDQARVGEGPEMLGRLQLGGVWGQEEQMDMLGHPQAHTGMPAGTVEDQDDLFVRASADLPGELGQFHLKERDRDTRGEMVQGPTRGRMDEPHQVAPFEAVADWGEGPLANRRPDASEQRLEANAMFVGRPQLDLGVRKSGRDGSYERADLFLKSACCSALASACRGRGTCRLCLARTR
jgi:hypothetical protein